jgi:hypothetical protein
MESEMRGKYKRWSISFDIDAEEDVINDDILEWVNHELGCGDIDERNPLNYTPILARADSVKIKESLRLMGGCMTKDDDVLFGLEARYLSPDEESEPVKEDTQDGSEFDNET